jgi:thioredoxin-like negative regulator of GroEL
MEILKMLQITSKNFEQEVVKSALPVLLLWGMNEPASSSLALQMMKLDPAKVNIARVDIDSSPDLAMQHTIRQCPLVQLFVNGMAIAQDTQLSSQLLEQVI